ncbi:MAG: glycosyltransferase family 4 protein, partial [Lentisphaerae bacterium]|nr:glycosyltransferase family 4 protein [Lentisphaerota bacterium]
MTWHTPATLSMGCTHTSGMRNPMILWQYLPPVIFTGLLLTTSTSSPAGGLQSIRRSTPAFGGWECCCIRCRCGEMRSASKPSCLICPDMNLNTCAFPSRAEMSDIVPEPLLMSCSDYPFIGMGRSVIVKGEWTGMIVVRRAWRAARVIAVSSTLRDLALRTWPEGRIEVIPNGVDVDRFQPCTHRDSAEVGGEMLLVVVA